MKFTLATSCLLFSLAIAYPKSDANPEAGAIIAKSITRISLSVDDLDTAFKSVNEPKTEAFLPLADKATALVPVLKQAQSDIEGAGRMSLFDLAGLAQVAQSALGVQDSMTKLTDDVVMKAPLIKQAGLAPVVLAQLNAQGDSTQGLMNAILNALPEAGKSLAEGALKGMEDPLAKVKAALS